MDESIIPCEKHFPSTSIPLGGLRYFEQTGSTNDMALAWAAADAPDLALVYAEEQTAGRGRGSRRWFTPAGAALAFSLVLRPLSGRGADPRRSFRPWEHWQFAKCWRRSGLHPEIKWPNDVLLNRRKVCGILAESVWLGEQVDSIVLGIGLNVKPEAVPPPEQLNFPATCLEAELPAFRADNPVLLDRAVLLQQILQAVLVLAQPGCDRHFPARLGKRLAFRGEQVEIRVEGQASKNGAGGWSGTGWESAFAFSAGAGFYDPVWGSAPASGCVIYFFV